MPFLHLTTFIAAPLQRVFDLSRSIDLHKQSMQRYREEPTGGLRTGLLKEGDVVAWQAKHLLKERKLKVKITMLKSPHAFVDEQVEGPFALLKHEHYFKPLQNGTFMIDQFRFEAPYGTIGRMANALFLKSYMERLLHERNAFIKKAAETDLWRKLLQQ